MEKVLNGKKIAESMKYICNAILAIMISILLNYGLVQIFMRNKKASYKEILEECNISFSHTPVIANKTGTRKEYSPVRDSSSSGGGFSSGGGRWRRILWKWRKPWILNIY